jgi:hypothetical protein
MVVFSRIIKNLLKNTQWDDVTQEILSGSVSLRCHQVGLDGFQWVEVYSAHGNCTEFFCEIVDLSIDFSSLKFRKTETCILWHFQ